MLYHVDNLHVALSEIERVLRPGGKLYCATNGPRHMQELDELMPAFMPHTPARDAIARFRLDNGMAALEQFFPRVSSHDRFDSLLVTEAEPLVAYCLSRTMVFARRAEIGPDQVARFHQHVEALLRARGGEFQVTKETGLFVASKG